MAKKMLHINVKTQDILLEGESYRQIMEELRNHAFDPKEDLSTYIDGLIKRSELFTGEKINMPVFSYETLVKELIRIGIFENKPGVQSFSFGRLETHSKLRR
jgi:hypothetical protein